MAASGGSSRRVIRVSAAIALAAGVLQLTLYAMPARAADNSPPASAPNPNSLTYSTAASAPAPDITSSPDEAGSESAPDTSPPVSYHYAPSVGVNGVPIGSVQDFLSEGINDSSPFGFAVQPDRRQLDSGETLSGLTIVSIKKGGAADQAGLHAFHNHIKKAIEAASVAGAFFFPPVIVLMPIFEASQTGDHYDMIVGIDGYRVRDVLDFADCMRDVQPNQPIYLNVVRDGVRTQMKVNMPDIFSSQ